MLICDTLIYAPYILTQNQDREILTKAALAISGGKIVAMSDAAALQAVEAKEILHLNHCMIMPGLVNSHTHVAMTYLRGLADDLPLMEWLTKYIFPIEKQLTADIVELSALLGCAEMIATGTTAFQDMYLFSEAVGEAVNTAGLKALIGEVLFSFESPAYKNEDEAFRLIENQVALWHWHPRIRLAVMPHSIYTTSPELLRCTVAFSKKYSLPVHLHLAETAEESETCLSAHGLRPIPYCESFGLLSDLTSIAHGIHITPEERTLLAKYKTTVVHNPKSNMKLASGTASILEMQQEGIPVALGTDGAASNNRLNMFSEMNVCALLHKLIGKDPSLAPAQSILDMATLGGAKALAWDGLGSLAVGGAADLIAIDLRSPNLQPMYNPVSHAVYAASGHEVYLSMVNGHILYQDRVFKSIDYPLVMHEMQKVVSWVKSRMQSSR